MISPIAVPGSNDEPLECAWGTSSASTGGRGMLLATAIPVMRGAGADDPFIAATLSDDGCDESAGCPRRWEQRSLTTILTTIGARSSPFAAVQYAA